VNIVVAVALVVIAALTILGTAGRWIDASDERHEQSQEDESRRT
jgi:hypothetical protein